MANWYMQDGELPYRDSFPNLYSLDLYNAPGLLWRMKDGELPDKAGFPILYDIDDGPESMWRMKDGILPYLSAFPKLYEIDDYPEYYWRMKDGELPYRITFPPMPEDAYRTYEKVIEYHTINVSPPPITIAIDWTKPMCNSYEYWTVSPNTWEDIEHITTVSSGTILRDLSSNTRCSASFDITNLKGEQYIRAYLISNQNGLTEKTCLGTFLLQTPLTRYDGIKRITSVNAYSPLIELNEKYPPICYTINKGSDVVPLLYQHLDANMRAVTLREYEKVKQTDYDIIAETSQTWLQFLSNVMSQNKLTYSIDPYGRFKIKDIEHIETLTPVWHYTDDRNSILYRDISFSQDLYNVPNVYEVYISLPEGTSYARVVNADPSSITSTVNRGREIVYRETSPSLTGIPTNEELQTYAKRRLKELSTIEVELSYSHAYCPVNIGDCVRIDYKAAGLTGIKAIVTSQSIELTSACKVNETAKFTTTFWR